MDWVKIFNPWRRIRELEEKLQQPSPIEREAQRAASRIWAGMPHETGLVSVVETDFGPVYVTLDYSYIEEEAEAHD